MIPGSCPVSGDSVAKTVHLGMPCEVRMSRTLFLLSEVEVEGHGIFGVSVVSARQRETAIRNLPYLLGTQPRRYTAYTDSN